MKKIIASIVLAVALLTAVPKPAQAFGCECCEYMPGCCWFCLIDMWWDHMGDDGWWQWEKRKAKADCVNTAEIVKEFNEARSALKAACPEWEG